MIEICGKPVRQTSIFKPNHSIGPRFSVRQFCPEIFRLKVASVIFVIAPIQIALATLGIAANQVLVDVLDEILNVEGATKQLSQSAEVDV